ncbi:TetR family transcriptional regulator [Nocardiopsis sp. Huas11]|uniref:TetR/AcrR family transcriptional regulator n=1 Tax=Nocardiopsis sp. Huas11 TaxID=2183912 RepID=UPI000EB5CAAE|nr:TetR/AcrR family transcriptional regulator [Nocardiopsis sp. Huas11]RKS08735.1 TetR family transcriptional regulator [Nocardiopsis sp. Huas11]
MVIYAGQSDVRRSMALLWRSSQESRERTAPGPKPELSVDLVVDTAIAVADEQGMGALSMKAVGERLGRTAMSLYTYVASKNELVELMYDQAFGELADAAEQTEALPWREATTAWAQRLWNFYLRHPWTLEVSQARPVLGPNEYRIFESMAAVLERAGLAPDQIRSTFGSLFTMVRGFVQTAAESRQAPIVTGQPEDEWWHGRAGQLEEVVPDFGERFPVLSRMAESGAFSNENESEPYLEQEAWETFRFGLEALLDGVEKRIGGAGR